MRVIQDLKNVYWDNFALKLTWGKLLQPSVTTANVMSVTEPLASYSSKPERAGNLTNLQRR